MLRFCKMVLECLMQARSMGPMLPVRQDTQQKKGE